jgi:hypothetical protein
MADSSYEERTDGALAEEMQRSLEVEVREEDGEEMLLLSWTCPACQHSCRRSGRLNSRFVGLVSLRGRWRKLPQTIVDVVRCDCGDPHPSRPEDGRGCGFWAQMTIVVRAS